jgi:nucleoside 2-deoxyribosyltransferase
MVPFSLEVVSATVSSQSFGEVTLLVYLASSLQNWDLNENLAEIISDLGHTCFLPQRDAPQKGRADETAKINVRAIEEADIVLLVGQHLGSDTAWEAGFARALNKRTILLSAQGEPVERSLMVVCAVDKLIPLSSYAEVRTRGSVLLRDIMGA